MSVYIDGMDMPLGCRDCPMEMYYMNVGESRCRANNSVLSKDYEVIPFDGRADNCPLISASEHVYVVRYYDYNNEQTTIEGIFRTWEETAAEIVDCYDGRFDYADLKEPEKCKWHTTQWEVRNIELDDGDFGKCLIIEKVKVG